ncbi:unnamed protein product, partial [Polarella glacialis]
MAPVATRVSPHVGLIFAPHLPLRESLNQLPPKTAVKSSGSVRRGSASWTQAARQMDVSRLTTVEAVLIAAAADEHDAASQVAYFLHLGELKAVIGERQDSSRAFKQLLASISQQASDGRLTARELRRILLAASHISCPRQWLLELSTVILDRPSSAQLLRDARSGDIARLGWSMARLGIESTSKMWMWLVEAAVVQMDSFSVADLSRLLWAYASMELRAPGLRLVKGTEQQVLRRRQELTPYALSNIGWSMARLMAQDTASRHLVEVISAGASEKSALFSSQDSANLAWAWATLRVQDGGSDCIRALCKEAAVKMGSFLPRQLSNLVWAVAKLSTPLQDEGELLQRAASSARLRLSEFNSQALSNLAWAWGTLHAENCSPLLGPLTDEASKRNFDLAPQGLSNFAWSLAKAAFRGAPESLGKLAAEATLRVVEMEVQHLANLAWAFASLDERSSEAVLLFDALAEESLERLDDFKPQELASLVWASARRHSFGGDFSSLPGLVVSSGLKKALPRLHEFAAAELTSVTWAAGAVIVSDPLFFQKVSAQAIQRVREFGPRELPGLLWGFAVASVADPDLCRAFATGSAARLDEFSVHGLASLSWSLATLDTSDNPEFWSQLEREASHRLPEFELQDLSNVAWAFATLHLSTGSDLLRAVAEEVPSRLQRRLATSSSEVAMDVTGILWALGQVNLPVKPLLEEAGVALRRLGASARHRPGMLQPMLAADSSWRFGEVRQATGQPHVVLELPDRLVLHKPPDWEVDQNDAAFDEELGATGASRLSRWLQALLPARQWPIVQDTAHWKGMAHRLDVPGSGLILTAKTHEAFYDLLLQLGAGIVSRDYCVLCHGWLRESRGVKACDGKYSTLAALFIAVVSYFETPRGWSMRRDAFDERGAFDKRVEPQTGAAQSARPSLRGRLREQLGVEGHPYEHLQARNYTFAKLEAFRLEQYRGLATFDVDVLFMRNASALAEVGPLAASRFPKGPNPASYLNTGVMVLRPSGRLYSEILATLHRGNYSLHYSDDEMTEQDVLIELCVLQGRCGDLHDLDACVYNHGAWIPGAHPRRCRRNRVVARHNFAATRETVLANSLQTAMYRGACRARTGAGRPRTCWSQDYHEEMCCRQDLRFGNPQCWGAGLSYERCCLGVDDSQRLRAELKYAGPSWYGLSSSPEPLPSRFIQAQCVNKYLPMRMTLAGMSSIMEAPADLEESY